MYICISLLGGVGGAIKKGVREMKIRPSQLKLHFNKLESSSIDTNSTNSPQRSTSPSVCSASSTSSSIHSSPSLRRQQQQQQQQQPQQPQSSPRGSPRSPRSPRIIPAANVSFIKICTDEELSLIRM